MEAVCGGGWLTVCFLLVGGVESVRDPPGRPGRDSPCTGGGSMRELFGEARCSRMDARLFVSATDADRGIEGSVAIGRDSGVVVNSCILEADSLRMPSWLLVLVLDRLRVCGGAVSGVGSGTSTGTSTGTGAEASPSTSPSLRLSLEGSGLGMPLCMRAVEVSVMERGACVGRVVVVEVVPSRLPFPAASNFVDGEI